MKDNTYKRMTIEERARAFAGDSPWITARLSAEQYADFVKSLEEVFRAVKWQAECELAESLARRYT